LEDHPNEVVDVPEKYKHLTPAHLDNGYGFFDTVNEMKSFLHTKADTLPEITGDEIDNTFKDILSKEFDIEREDDEWEWEFDYKTNVFTMRLYYSKSDFHQLREIFGKKVITTQTSNGISLRDNKLLIKIKFPIQELLDFIIEREPNFFSKVSKDMPDFIKNDPKYSHLGDEYGFFDTVNEYHHSMYEPEKSCTFCVESNKDMTEFLDEFIRKLYDSIYELVDFKNEENTHDQIKSISILQEEPKTFMVCEIKFRTQLFSGDYNNGIFYYDFGPFIKSLNARTDAYQGNNFVRYHSSGKYDHYTMYITIHQLNDIKIVDEILEENPTYFAFIPEYYDLDKNKYPQLGIDYGFFDTANEGWLFDDKEKKILKDIRDDMLFNADEVKNISMNPMIFEFKGKKITITGDFHCYEDKDKTTISFDDFKYSCKIKYGEEYVRPIYGFVQDLYNKDYHLSLFHIKLSPTQIASFRALEDKWGNRSYEHSEDTELFLVLFEKFKKIIKNMKIDGNYVKSFFGTLFGDPYPIAMSRNGIVDIDREETEMEKNEKILYDEISKHFGDTIEKDPSFYKDLIEILEMYRFIKGINEIIEELKQKYSELGTDYGFFDTVNEKAGYPDAIRPISNLIKHKIYERFNKWINRKGKFANFNEVIEIPYEEIKKWTDVLSPEFRDYPVEFITLEFRINVKDTGEPHEEHSGLAFHLTKKSDTSTWIYSETPGIYTAYKIHIQFEFRIPRYANSVNIDRMKTSIENVIDHEILHSYENSKNPKKFVKNVEGWSTEGYYNFFPEFQIIYDFFWLIYSSSSIEARARVAGFSSNEKPEETSWELLKRLKNFSAEETIDDIRENFDKQCKDVMKMYGKDQETVDYFEKEFQKLYKTFGNIFIKFYRSIGRDVGAKIPSYMLKFKNKNIWEVLVWWEDEFKRRAEYLRRKFAKKMTYFGNR
jgi:hypothetical protein